MYSSFKRYMALLATYLKPQWHRTIVLAILTLGGIAVSLLHPQILRSFIDSATTSGLSFGLLYLGLLYIALALVSQGMNIAGSYLKIYVGWTAMNSLRRDLLQHCLALDLSYHKSHTPGEMIERIDGDVNQLSNFFSNFLVSIVSHILLLVGILVLYFVISWLVGLVMVIYVVLAFLALTSLRGSSVPRWEKQRQASADFFGFLTERLSGTEDIRANGATNYTMRRFMLMRREWFPINRNANRSVSFMIMGMIGISLTGLVLSLGLGAYLWGTGAISVGTVYVMFSYALSLAWPLRQIQSQLQDLQQAQACIKRVEELLNIKSALSEGHGDRLPDGALSVELDQVTFGYLPDQPVLREFSFQLRAGRVLGILGRTGSGKSTIARLLFRLYDPQQGEIRLGGVPLKQAALRDLRRHIGLVTQDVQLFHATVRDNLTFFDRTIPDERILGALAEVGLSTWYQSLAEGLDTTLGSDGEGLSAGQAQLLAFTRVFLSDPGLVILDEASSRLDPVTERLIEQAINKLFHNRTAIVIAHRLGTVQRADDILVIDDGRVLEYADRIALANDPDSRFSYLLQTGLETADEASSALTGTVKG